jgi:hypothetical protein
VREMNPIDQLLLELDNVKELMKCDTEIIESSIPRLIELLDTFQSCHLNEEANFITVCFLSLGNKILPYLRLNSQDTSFFHYFSYHVIPKCSDELLILMKQELFKVVEKNDITEESDLHMIKALFSRDMFIEKLNEILIEKKNRILQTSKEDGVKQNIVLEYIVHLNTLIKD